MSFPGPVLRVLPLLLAGVAPAQVYLSAAPGDPYAHIESKGYGIESPECKHAVKHITVVNDAELGKDVFVFTLHRDLDDDRCESFDRQRLEIKTWDKSPDNMSGSIGETHTYRWKFKLDAGFKPSNSFTHIHQIKAQGGSEAGSPLWTLTPRLDSPEKLELIRIGSDEVTHVVAEANLSLFKGQWVEAEEKVTYGEKGSLSLTLRRAKDQTTLLYWSGKDLDLWRDGAGLMRPKYGLYRSLNNKSQLRDESVRFADFCLAEGNAVCASGETGIRFAPKPGPRIDALRTAPYGTLDLVAPDGRAWEGLRRPAGKVLLPYLPSALRSNRAR
jgi:hypothetical protein